MGQVLLSLCMIIKDEAKQLPGFIRSHQGLFDQWVIVDTGSTDGSSDILDEAGLTLHSWEWSDDFAAARNHALSLCCGKWVLALDADERLAPEDHHALRSLCSTSEVDAYILPIKNYVTEDGHFEEDPSRLIDYCPPDNSYSRSQGVSEDYGYTMTELIRLFRRERGFSWQSPVHEVLECKGKARLQSLTHPSIHHLGTLDREAKVEDKNAHYAAIARALDKDIRACDPVKKIYECAKFLDDLPRKKELLGWALAKAPRDPQLLKELINTYLSMGELEEALAATDCLFSVDTQKLEYCLAKVHCLSLVGKLEEAWDFLKMGFRRFRQEPMYLYALASLAVQTKRYKEALSYSSQAAQRAPKVQFIQCFHKRVHQAIYQAARQT